MSYSDKMVVLTLIITVLVQKQKLPAYWIGFVYLCQTQICYQTLILQSSLPYMANLLPQSIVSP